MIATNGLHARLVRAFFVTLLALGIAAGLTAQSASAAKVAVIDCASLYDSAIAAGNRSLAAGKRGDSISSDLWWGVYISLEALYMGNCDGPSGAMTT